MDTTSIYVVSENYQKFDSSLKTNSSLKANSSLKTNRFELKKSAWLLYGRNIPLALKQELKKMHLVPKANWMVDAYEVLLIMDEITQEASQICDHYHVDVAPIRDIPDIRQSGLALFDMDSTAIEIECIDEIAKLAGVGEQIANITERAMRGELDFAASLKERVAKLNGVNIELLSQIKLPLTSGMQKLCATLRHFGWHLAVASGGFTFFAEQLKDMLALSYIEANQLGIKNGVLTGEVVGNIVDAKRKATVLCELAASFHLPLSQTIAIGDGANDLPMMFAAGLGIAYKAKPSVEKRAQIAIRHADLGGVMCVLSASLIH